MKQPMSASAAQPDALYFTGNPREDELHFTVSSPPDPDCIRILQAMTIPCDEGKIYLRDQPEERHPVIDPAVGWTMIYFIGRETDWQRVFHKLDWKNTSANKKRLHRAILAGNRCCIQIRQMDGRAEDYTEQLIPSFSTSSCDGDMFEIVFSIRTNLFEFLFENPAPTIRISALAAIRPHSAEPFRTPPTS